MFKKIINDKEYLKKVLSMAIPVIIQQLLLSTFSIVDTMMVGSIERGVASVGIAAQINTIALIITFGITVGIGLYMAQFYGAKNTENLKKSFALMTIIIFLLGIIFTFISLTFPRQLISFFTDDEFIISKSMTYLKISAFSYIPHLISYAFSMGYRNIQKTRVPLYISCVTAVLNVFFNIALIKGNFGFPELGIRGAAIGTIIATSAGLICNVFYALKNKTLFMPKFYHYRECLRKTFFTPIIKRTLPMLINEIFFAMGTSLYIVIFNKIGPDSYEAFRMCETILSFLLVIVLGINSSVTSIIGEQLGLENFEKAKNYANNFFKIGLIVSIVMGIITILFAKVFIGLFNNPIEEANFIAISLLSVFAIRLALRTFVMIIFGIFRAGGNSGIVMVLDSGILWVIGVPIAFIGYYILGINNIIILYLFMQLEPFIRVIIGIFFYAKGKWVRNLIKRIN